MVADLKRPLKSRNRAATHGELNGRSARNGTVYQSPPADDPFYYGWRIVVETGPNDEEIITHLPLTQADFLDPQLGDQMVQADNHYRQVNSLFDRYDAHYLNDPTTAVMSDVKMLWGIPGLQEPAPDLAVIPDITTKDQAHSSFNVTREGTRPCLVVEVVSPKYPGDDTTKVDIYEQAGIAEYIIIYPHSDDETEPVEIIGYRLVGGYYQEIAPDAQGRLYSATTDMWFGVRTDGLDVVLTDGTTSELLLDNREAQAQRLLAEQRAEEEAQARQRAEQRAANAERRAADAEAEIARLRARYQSQPTSRDEDSEIKD